MYLIKAMNLFVNDYSGKYLLIPFHRQMRHSMFDFIFDLKNIQRINTRKTQDYYRIIQK